jgi:hypothetical protein
VLPYRSETEHAVSQIDFVSLVPPHQRPFSLWTQRNHGKHALQTGQRVHSPRGSYGDARRERDPHWPSMSNYARALWHGKGRTVFLAG